MITPDTAARVAEKVFSTGDRISWPAILFIIGVAVGAFLPMVLK